jgi:glucose/arabinose dehydrogenase
VQQPKVASSHHCGGRLVFARDGRLFVTLGDRFSRKDDAQNLARQPPGQDRAHRRRRQGRRPTTPSSARPALRPEVWSLGHRNVQGAALHPDSGELWASEHGPQGGDEINRVLAGPQLRLAAADLRSQLRQRHAHRRGGPESGLRAAAEDLAADFHRAQRHGLPDQRALPRLEGQPVRRGLRGEALIRLTLDGRRVVGEQRLMSSLKARIRDVRQGPDGWLYLLTDNADGRLIRIER